MYYLCKLVFVNKSEVSRETLRSREQFNPRIIFLFHLSATTPSRSAAIIVLWRGNPYFSYLFIHYNLSSVFRCLTKLLRHTRCVIPQRRWRLRLRRSAGLRLNIIIFIINFLGTRYKQRDVSLFALFQTVNQHDVLKRHWRNGGGSRRRVCVCGCIIRVRAVLRKLMKLPGRMCAQKVFLGGNKIEWKRFPMKNRSRIMSAGASKNIYERESERVKRRGW